MKKQEILNKSVEETGLSIKTIQLLKKVGIQNIKSIIKEGTISYEKLYNIIIKTSQENEKLEELQHCYIELIQYLEFYGIKIIDESQTQKTIKR